MIHSLPKWLLQIEEEVESEYSITASSDVTSSEAEGEDISEQIRQAKEKRKGRLQKIMVNANFIFSWIVWTGWSQVSVSRRIVIHPHTPKKKFKRPSHWCSIQFMATSRSINICSICIFLSSLGVLQYQRKYCATSMGGSYVFPYHRLLGLIVLLLKGRHRVFYFRNDLRVCCLTDSEWRVYASVGSEVLKKKKRSPLCHGPGMEPTLAPLTVRRSTVSQKAVIISYHSNTTPRWSSIRITCRGRKCFNDKISINFWS